MNCLSETALAFARECMGWEDAMAINDFGHPYIMRESARRLAPIPGARKHFFNPTDLNAVMDVAQNWCLSQQPKLCADVGFNCTAKESTFDAFIRDPDGEIIANTAFKDSAAHALIAVCLDAARQLKGAA